MRSIRQFVLSLILLLGINAVFAQVPYGMRICQDAHFTCVKVEKHQSWESLFPDDSERSIVMRVNRLNTSLYPGQIIAVPRNLSSATIMDFSPFPLQVVGTGEKMVILDPQVLAWGAYDANGTLVNWGPGIMGKDFCPDVNRQCRTSVGSYRVFQMGSSNCYSTKFPIPRGGAPMPYCMYFNNGQAIHGGPGGIVGYNASHGCVRTYVNDAEWLRYNFVEIGTRIIVKPY